MNNAAREIIAQLGLAPLPAEGGFFRVTHRTASSSAILYVLTEPDFSALHRIGQDETWHFHLGDPVDHFQIDPRTGVAAVARMGADVLAGHAPQVFVPAGTWQGARLARTRGGQGFALLGCTVSPPYDERSFELWSRAAAVQACPAWAELVIALTR